MSSKFIKYQILLVVIEVRGEILLTEKTNKIAIFLMSSNSALPLLQLSLVGQ
jgi:hypothetical protein